MLESLSVVSARDPLRWKGCRFARGGNFFSAWQATAALDEVQPLCLWRPGFRTRSKSLSTYHSRFHHLLSVGCLPRYQYPCSSHGRAIGEYEVVKAQLTILYNTIWSGNKKATVSNSRFYFRRELCLLSPNCFLYFSTDDFSTSHSRRHFAPSRIPSRTRRRTVSGWNFNFCATSSTVENCSRSGIAGKVKKCL